jgi:hypothetical protein
MAWTPLTKGIVILSILAIAGGLYVLTGLFFGLTGVLPPLALGIFNHTESWGIIGTVLLFLAWFLMFLGLKLEDL